MKPKILLLITFLFLLSLISFSQIKSGSVTYAFKAPLKQDSTIVISDRASKMIKHIRDEINNFEATLLFSGSKASFILSKDMDIDNQTKYYRKSAKGLFNLKDSYFADIETGSISRESEFDGRKFIIVSKIKDLKWKLTNKTKKIGNYVCYKAETTSSYETRKGKRFLAITAWYTPEIAVPFGPKNYVGLPGLILELEEGKDRISFIAKDLKFDKKNKINEPKDGIRVTEKEYNEIVNFGNKKYFNSIIDR